MSNLERIEERLGSGDHADVLGAMEELEGLLRRKEWSGPMPPSLAILLASQDDGTRRKAIWLIGKSAQNKIEAAYPLETVTALSTDPDDEVRENSAWAIGEMAALGLGGTAQSDRLLSLLKDESSHVRGMAAWAMGRLAERRGIKEPSAAEGLRSLLIDKSNYVRTSAAWALERF